MVSGNSKPLRLYSFLAKYNLPRSYIGKIMLVAFVGTHIPLLTLLVYFLLRTNLTSRICLNVMGISLLATLLGTGLTLFTIHNLLQPVRVTCQAMRRYLAASEMPALPTGFTDEAGVLMADAQVTLTRLDSVIRQLAYYDDLTGLPNRLLFQERLRQATAAAQRHGETLAVLLIDIAGLKEINEVFGHEVGDQLLRALIDRIGQQVREADVFARVGDDEFALLQTQMEGPDSAVAQAQRLLELIASHPFTITGNEINVRAVIGIALFPHDASEPEDLLRDAEIARNQAREQKKANSSFCFFDVGMNTRLRRRLELEAGLRLAIARDEVQLHYQPQVSNRSGKIIGTEALLRWSHPVHGPVSPVEFIPIAEESDLILLMGDWVLRTACRQNKAWQEAGFPPVRMAVNLSARQLQLPDLIERVASVLHETELDPKWLELEVTESVAMEDARQAIGVLYHLRSLGITLSLDDFGTGYSSLSQLKRLPLDNLKIDQSFVHDVTENAENASITNAIISLAHSLQLEVIAEGVETEAQFHYLKSNGADLSQGYFFSHPVTAEAMEALFRQELPAGKETPDLMRL